MARFFGLLAILSLIFTPAVFGADPPGGGPGGVPVIRDNSPDYQQGWKDGYSQGQGKGRIEGRAAGLTEGTRAGEQQGKREGELAGQRDGEKAGKSQGHENGVRDGQNQGQADGIRDGQVEAVRRSRAEGFSTGRNDGYNAGFAEGSNAGSYQTGYDAGAAKARQEEEFKGIAAGRKAGFTAREEEIRKSVLAGVVKRSLAVVEQENLGAEIVTVDNDSALMEARLGDPKASADYEKGKKDGYEAGYRQAYNEFKKVGYDLGYQQAFTKARDQAYGWAYERAFKLGIDQGYSLAYRQYYDATYRRYYDRYAVIRDEWAYQEGYGQGFNEGKSDGYNKAVKDQYDKGYDKGYRETAAIVYPQAYAQGLELGKQAADEYYNGNPVIEFRRLVLFDENDDGVYMAGEAVGMVVEMVNFGGVATNPELQLRGDGGLELVPGVAFGTVAPRSTMTRELNMIHIKPEAGHNVTLSFRVDSFVNGKNIQQKLLEIMVTNPHTTRYRMITSALYWIDNAITASNKQVPENITIGRTMTHAILTIPNFDTNSDFAKRAKNASDKLNEGVKNMTGKPADMIRVAISRLTEPDLKVKIEQLNANPTQAQEVVIISVTHKKGIFSNPENYKEKFLLADLPMAYDKYRFVDAKVQKIDGKGSVNEPILDDISYRFTFRLSKSWLSSEKATATIAITLERVE